MLYCLYILWRRTIPNHVDLSHSSQDVISFPLTHTYMLNTRHYCSFFDQTAAAAGNADIWSSRGTLIKRRSQSGVSVVLQKKKKKERKKEKKKRNGWIKVWSNQGKVIRRLQLNPIRREWSLMRETLSWRKNQELAWSLPQILECLHYSFDDMKSYFNSGDEWRMHPQKSFLDRVKDSRKTSHNQTEVTGVKKVEKKWDSVKKKKEKKCTILKILSWETEKIKTYY